MCLSTTFSALFEFISAKTQTYFRKYVYVFPEIFTRISANKFDVGLKKRRFVPDGDMCTSLAGTKACPRCGRSRALGADMGISRPQWDLGTYAENALCHTSHSLPAFFFFAITRIIGSKTIMMMIAKPT